MNRIRIQTGNYDLAATLDSGQAFRWNRGGDRSWQGVIGTRHVIVCDCHGSIEISTPSQPGDWQWAHHYFQTGFAMDAALQSFPADHAMREAVAYCPGLRLLQQDPWECLASFVLSSNKQIVQIRQMVDLLCRHYGKPIENHGEGDASLFSFPGPSIIASSNESALRQLKLGYRAPYLLQTARMVDQGMIDLAGLPSLPVEEARNRLLSLPGVGRKIADCVLLFSCGFLCAFPVDVWIQRVLCQIYFSNRRITASRLAAFTDAYFGPFGGLAQQFLFHWIRTGSPDPERYRVPYRDRRPSRIPPFNQQKIQ